MLLRLDKDVRHAHPIGQPIFPDDLLRAPLLQRIFLLRFLEERHSMSMRPIAVTHTHTTTAADQSELARTPISPPGQQLELETDLSIYFNKKIGNNQRNLENPSIFHRIYK